MTFRARPVVERIVSRFCALVLTLFGFVPACASDAARARVDSPTPLPRPANGSVRVVAVGDILLGDLAQKRLDKYGYDYPFRYVRPWLEGAAAVVGNLEGPITRVETPLDRSKSHFYRCHPEAARALHDAGVGLVSLANNHALDYGSDGLAETIANLDAAGVRHFGAAASSAAATRAEIVDVGGTKIGFLGFMERYGPYGSRYPDYFATSESGGVTELCESALRDGIGALRPQVQLVIVCCHWGENYKLVTETQRRFGHLAVDLGADLVIGHHPHIAQGVEIYRSTPILYSLGNFTFGTKGQFDEIDPALRNSWLADIVIRDARIREIDLVPLVVDNDVVHYQPRIADAETLRAMVARLNEPFGTDLTLGEDRARLVLTETRHAETGTPPQNRR